MVPLTRKLVVLVPGAAGRGWVVLGGEIHILFIAFIDSTNVGELRVKKDRLYEAE